MLDELTPSKDSGDNNEFSLRRVCWKNEIGELSDEWGYCWRENWEFILNHRPMTQHPLQFKLQMNTKSHF